MQSEPPNVLAGLYSDVSKSVRPPESLVYSEWAAKHWRLGDNSALKGRYKPWKPQRQILDAMGDPLIEYVDVVKGTRVGYTTLLIASIGADQVSDPSPEILLMPTDDDARGIVVDEVDPAFENVPILRGLMPPRKFDDRNTLTQRRLVGGGSLKILSARAPRNLRRHTAKRLKCDEIDGMEITKEGDPILLAIKRTESYADRTVHCGSSPTEDVVSLIWARYQNSDKRVFEWPCPKCGAVSEPKWEHFRWTEGKHDDAVWVCPHCASGIEERFKTSMVEDGSFRATKLEVKGHAGFHYPSILSLQPKASWAALAKEFEEAKRGGPTQLKVFYNTVLALPWTSSLEHIDEHALVARAEPFGIVLKEDEGRWDARIPAEVLYLTAGVDVQADRLEITIIGWSRKQRFILGHEVIRGATNLESTWAELDTLLGTTWKHPLGGDIGIEAAGIDAGDGNRTQQVLDFCGPRSGRRIMAVKGVGGPRPTIERSKAKKSRRLTGTVAHYNVGVDQVKTDLLTAVVIEPKDKQGNLQVGALRFSDTLDNEWFRQFTSERRVIRSSRGRPKVEWHRLPNRQAEALDATVYGVAVRNLCRFDYDKRELDLTGTEPEPTGSLKKAVRRLHGH